jgi:hypothetical protein
MTLTEAGQVLEDLVDAHLLQQPAPGRYRFHDLLRDHARAAARQAEPEAARSDAIGRALDYYLHVAHEADTILSPGRARTSFDLAHPPACAPPLAGQAGALSWCESEYANLMSAISYASTHGWHGHASQLPRSIWFYFYTRLHLQDWIATHRLALTAASRLHEALTLVRQAGSHYVEAQILNDLGASSAAAERTHESATHHRAALTLATRTGNPYEQARAHAGIAHTLYRMDPGGARRHRDQALAIITDLGVPEAHLIPEAHLKVE